MIKNRIKHEFSAPYSPHQNGTAERSWRSIFDMTRCLLLEAKLPKTLWTYAVRASAYIRNRCYNPRTGKTPYEVFTGTKPNLSNMHVLGTICYAYVQDKKKLDPRSEQGVFLGYDGLSPAYLVYFPEKNDVKRVRCVKFNVKPLLETVVIDVEENYNRTEPDPQTTVTSRPQATATEAADQQEEHQEDPAVTTTENSSEQKTRYPQRRRNNPKYMEDYVLEPELSNISKCAVDYCYRVADIPRTYEEAVSSSQSEQWHKAMDEEMKSLKDNDTYDLVPPVEGRSVVGGRWVYAVKLGPDNEEKFKARYVAKGYLQIHNVDYQETFSPTARVTSIRMLLQLAVQEDLIVHQMDVKTAYLNANIDCLIYMQQPVGYIETDVKGQNLVCKLNKSLYGLKQSGRNWNNVLHDFLVNIGFEQSFADQCLYTRYKDNIKIILIIYVDDIILAASNNAVLDDVKISLCNRFKMKDLGKLSWFLGMGFSFEKDCIKINQTKYVEKILDRFEMSDCNPKSIPCDLSVSKIITSDSKELCESSLYREIVGSLIYVMTGTRPDLAYVVTKLSQHMASPTKALFGIAKHVLKYLKGTKSYDLKFTKSNSPLKLVGHCDSDWGASEDRRSITGYCYQLNSNGPIISWKSKKQNVVALSSCEAEYMALTAAMQEANFLRQLFADMQDCTRESVTLFADNQGAIALAKNPVHHQRSKHIDIKYHFIRQQVEDGSVDLQYVPSIDNIADLFTKPLSKMKLDSFSIIRGVHYV
jgi:hypothetical protein